MVVIAQHGPLLWIDCIFPAMDYDTLLRPKPKKTSVSGLVLTRKRWLPSTTTIKWSQHKLKWRSNFKTNTQKTPLFRSKGWHYLDVLCVMLPYSAVSLSLLLPAGIRGVGRLEYLWLGFNIKERWFIDKAILSRELQDKPPLDVCPLLLSGFFFFFMKMWREVGIATRWLTRP